MVWVNASVYSQAHLITTREGLIFNWIEPGPPSLPPCCFTPVHSRHSYPFLFIAFQIRSLNRICGKEISSAPGHLQNTKINVHRFLLIPSFQRLAGFLNYTYPSKLSLCYFDDSNQSLHFECSFQIWNFWKVEIFQNLIQC